MIEEFIKVLETGCIEETFLTPFEELDIFKAKHCVSLLKDIVNDKKNLNKFMKDLTNNQVANAYFGEIAEEWINLLNFKFIYKSCIEKEDINNKSCYYFGRILFVETNIYNEDFINKKEHLLYRLQNFAEEDLTIVDFIVKKLNEFGQNYIKMFSIFCFYYLYAFGRNSLREEIKEMMSIYELKDDWYLLDL